MARSGVLSDEAWARLEPLLPSSAGVRGRPFRDHRQVLEGIVFRYRTGCAWRDLPEEFGPWQTVWKRHHRFSLDGTWDRILTALQARADAVGELDWTVSVDSSISRVHQHGASAARAGDHPGGRRRPAGRLNRLTMAWAVPAAACRPRPIWLSTAAAGRWPSSSGPGRAVTPRCSAHCWPPSGCPGWDRDDRAPDRRR